MDLSAVVAGLETNLQTVSGLRVVDIFEGTVNPPMAVVDLPAVDFDIVFGRGADMLEVPVVVLVGKASERAGRKKLIDYIDGTGATSIKTAIESDKTLGGAADSVWVKRAERAGQYVIGNVAYIGVTYVVAVVA